MAASKQREPRSSQCPLCGEPLRAHGMDALGKHFEVCPNTLTGREHG